ncbi:hypothetical protein BAC2_01859 [uncultured bacterium]|nr:hypothetical protein BAC2_01859 [uncultured bacterium]
MDLERCWQEATGWRPVGTSLTEENMHAIIASRVRQEFVRVGEFVWASILHQVILYAFLAHTVARHWGESEVVALCVTGVAFCMPITVALVRRTGALYGTIRGAAPDGAGIRAVVIDRRSRLVDFYRFKKRLDWFGVPVSCAVIVFVTFTLFVREGLTGHPIAASGMFVFWVVISLIAIHAENKKRFDIPIEHLGGLITEFDEPGDGSRT